jgi:hypothetical protein
VEAQTTELAGEAGLAGADPSPTPSLSPNRTLTELAGKAGLAAQREAWAEVMDCGTELEGLLKGRANQVA